MLVTASHVVTGVTRSDRRRRLGQSVVQSVTILQLFGAAVCVMNRLDCDVDMGKPLQSELPAVVIISICFLLIPPAHPAPLSISSRRPTLPPAPLFTKTYG